MRILVIHTYYKLKGGEDSVVANEIALLRSAGMEVEQLSFSNSGSTLLKLLQVPFNYSSYRKTLRKVREFKPDVVHIHNLHFSGSAAVVYAVDQLKVPIVMTLHNYRMLCPSGSLYHNNQLFMDSLEAGFAWQAVWKGVYQNSKAITFWIAASMYLHQQLGTWNKISRFIVLGQHSKDLFSLSKFAGFADRTVVKPNFCFPPLQADRDGFTGEGLTRSDQKEAGERQAGLATRPAVALQTAEPVLSGGSYLYIGRLTEEKGLPVLLKAFAASGHVLNIVGTGPLEEMVRDYSMRYPNISFHGEQPMEKVHALLEQTAALIFPSVWYETFGMVVIEAFARGVPVIASDLGNIKNLVDEGINGLRFEAGDDQDLRKKVTLFDELPLPAKATLSRNARQTYLRHYTPEANSAQLIGLYRSVAPGAN